MEQKKTLDISWETIFKISIAVFILYVLYLVKDILIWFIFALVVSILFNPIIDFIHRRRVPLFGLRIPRAIAVTIIYFLFFGIATLFVFYMASAFIGEVDLFSQSFSQYFETIAPPLQGIGFESFSDLETFIGTLERNLENIADNIFSALFSIFGGIFTTFFIITIAIFLSLEEKAIEKFLLVLFPRRYESYALSLWGSCQRKVSGWFGVRVLGSIFIGVACYIAFEFFFKIDYPFLLASLAAILEFIPIVGPLITGIIIFLIVGINDLLQGVFVLIFFILIQQIEGNILTPVLTRKFIGLPPALVLVSLAVGGKLWGIPGAILTIPLAGILFEFLRDFLKKRKEESPD